MTEALLEMHFHRAIVSAFEAVYGARFLRLLKPSAQKEAWVGFDQGWVRTAMPLDSLLAELQKSIQTGGAPVEGFYLGYFLQFKTVRQMRKRSRNIPPPTYRAPYLRVELSLERNPRTGKSQHETLLSLTRLKNAKVNYVCAMMTSIDEVYEEPDLARLRIIDVATSPTGWATNTSHYIIFQDESDIDPQWCSEPSPARSWPFVEWLHRPEWRPPRLTASELESLLRDTQNVVGEAKVLPESLNVMSMSMGESRRSAF